MALAYDERGSGNEKTLVFLHAFPLDRTMWKNQLDAFASHARVLAPDMPGFGESPALEGKASISAYAKSLLSFLDDCSVERATLCGCSFGGYILFESLRLAPDRIAGVILCDTRAEADAPEVRENRLKTIKQVRETGTGPLAEAMVEKILGESALNNLPNLVKDVEKSIRAAKPEGVIAALQAMADRPGSTETLAKIKVPALILVGDEDKLTPPSAAEIMQEGIAGSRMHIIPYAGHLSPLENPSAVNYKILAFLESF